MKKRYILLLLAFLSVCGHNLYATGKASPQSSPRDSLYWEKVIEAYSDFCRLYDDAKSKGVSSSVALERKASDIKALLSESHGKMSSEQYRRFEKLRERYSGIPVFSGVGETAAQVKKVVKEVYHVTDTVVIIKEIGRKDTVHLAVSDSAGSRALTLPDVSPSPVSGLRALCLSDDLSLSSGHSYPLSNVRFMNSVIPEKGYNYVIKDGVLRYRYPAVPFMSMRLSLIPDFYGGGYKLGFGFQYGRRFGVYADFNDIMLPKKSDYSCTSDGTTSYGRIWTTGEERGSLFSITGGGTALLNRHWSLYVGAGYGDWSYQWQDVDGLWAEVSDQSYKGLVLETGIAYQLFPQIPISISIGVQTLGFNRYTLKIGLYSTD